MSRQLYKWVEVGPLAGATVKAPVIRMATDYRYHVTLDFGKLDDAFRARVLSALQHGYTTLDEVREFLQAFYKPYKFVCGYIGKSQAYFPLPDLNSEEVKDMKTRVRASCVMAGLDKGVIVSMSTVEETVCVSVAIKFAHHNRIYEASEKADRIMIEKKGDQLANRLSFLRGIAEEIGVITYPKRRHFHEMVLNREKIECLHEGRYEHKLPEPRRKRS